MSAERLRAAASLLRERAEAATPGPWAADAYSGNDGWQVNGAGTVFADEHTLRNDAQYIATMAPPVAHALADWLDHEADRIESVDGPYPLEITPGEVRRSRAVADAILGTSA